MLRAQVRRLKLKEQGSTRDYHSRNDSCQCLPWRGWIGNPLQHAEPGHRAGHRASRLSTN